jgi:intracellular sulfur oxidation DsrE/DsrF family protein
MAGIVPGALVVPAGVMAINACQEAKFTYIQSSV